MLRQQSCLFVFITKLIDKVKVKYCLFYESRKLLSNFCPFNSNSTLQRLALLATCFRIFTGISEYPSRLATHLVSWRNRCARRSRASWTTSFRTSAADRAEISVSTEIPPIHTQISVSNNVATFTLMLVFDVSAVKEGFSYSVYSPQGLASDQLGHLRIILLRPIMV